MWLAASWDPDAQRTASPGRPPSKGRGTLEKQQEHLAPTPPIHTWMSTEILSHAGQGCPREQLDFEDVSLLTQEWMRDSSRLLEKHLWDNPGLDDQESPQTGR